MNACSEVLTAMPASVARTYPGKTKPRKVRESISAAYEMTRVISDAAFRLNYNSSGEVELNSTKNDADFYKKVEDFLSTVADDQISRINLNSYVLETLFEGCADNLVALAGSHKGKLLNASATMTEGSALVINALSDDRWDFRTIPGISRSIGLPEHKVHLIIEQNQSLIRKSLVPNKNGVALYTLASRSKKLREILSEVRTFLSKST